jgi:hypothetical protein
MSNIDNKKCRPGTRQARLHQVASTKLVQADMEAAHSLRPVSPVRGLHPDFLIAEHFYQDGPPYWTDRAGRLPQTAEEAEAARRNLVRNLRKADTHLCSYLANLIEGCRPGHRCRSEACSHCRRASQRAYVHAASRLHKQSDAPWAAFCIILNTHIRGGSDIEHTRRLMRQVTNEPHAAFENVGVSWAIGGFDVSYNVFGSSANHKDHPAATSGKFQPFFHFHVYGHAPFHELHAAKPLLKEMFPATKTNKNTVRISPRPFDGHLASLAYAMKPDFCRRFTILAHESEGGIWERQDSRDKPLRVSERVLLALMLHLLGPGGRFFLHGTELKNDKSGDPVIRLISET